MTLRVSPDRAPAQAQRFEQAPPQAALISSRQRLTQAGPALRTERQPAVAVQHSRSEMALRPKTSRSFVARFLAGGWAVMASPATT